MAVLLRCSSRQGCQDQPLLEMQQDGPGDLERSQSRQQVLQGCPGPPLLSPPQVLEELWEGFAKVQALCYFLTLQVLAGWTQHPCFNHRTGKQGELCLLCWPGATKHVCCTSPAPCQELPAQLPKASWLKQKPASSPAHCQQSPQNTERCGLHIPGLLQLPLHGLWAGDDAQSAAGPLWAQPSGPCSSGHCSMTFPTALGADEESSHTPQALPAQPVGQPETEGHGPQFRLAALAPQLWVTTAS